MMTLEQVVAEVQRLGLHVSANGHESGVLNVEPRDRVPAELEAALCEHKAALLVQTERAAEKRRLLHAIETSESPIVAVERVRAFRTAFPDEAPETVEPWLAVLARESNPNARESYLKWYSAAKEFNYSVIHARQRMQALVRHAGRQDAIASGQPIEHDAWIKARMIGQLDPGLRTARLPELRPWCETWMRPTASSSPSTC